MTVDINPDIKLTGLSEGELVTEDRVPLAAELNFSVPYVKYEIIKS